MRRRRKRKKKVRWIFVCLLLCVVAGAVVWYTRCNNRKLQIGKNITSEAAPMVSIPEIKWTPEAAEKLTTGTVIGENEIEMDRIEDYFTVNRISEEIAGYITGKSYTPNDHIELDDLRYLRILHYNYDHEIQVGELIVNEKIAQDCKNVFLELFSQEYEIESMYLIEKYWTGDSVDSDTNSIEHNNTSAFNYRVVPGTKKLSNHAAGFAIDINPLQNPYVKYKSDGSFDKYYKNMEDYIDRTSGKAHMITHEDICYQIFTKYGFTWGGDWNSSKDYQHFEKRVD